jgi:leader peptidase (prepilin peptidase)/N-methyltransferase
MPPQGLAAPAQDRIVQTGDAYLAALVLLLLPAVVSDLTQHRMPPAIPAAVAVLGCAQAWTAAPGLRTLLACLTQSAVLAVLLGGLVLLFRRARPQGQALGAGDAALLAASAAWVGVSGSVVVLFVASLTLLLGVVAAAPWQGFDFKRARPFGPGLALGLVVVVLAARLQRP